MDKKLIVILTGIFATFISLVAQAQPSSENLFFIVDSEDSQSLRYKLDILKEFNLRGVSVWRLGWEDGAA